MGGLRKLCKLYGSIEVADQFGNKVIHVWDYANDKPRLKSKMTKEEIAASERAKYEQAKELFKNVNYKSKK